MPACQFSVTPYVWQSCDSAGIDAESCEASTARVGAATQPSGPGQSGHAVGVRSARTASNRPGQPLDSRLPAGVGPLARYATPMSILRHLIRHTGSAVRQTRYLVATSR
jgi:hypothetical protein